MNYVLFIMWQLLLAMMVTEHHGKIEKVQPYLIERKRKIGGNGRRGSVDCSRQTDTCLVYELKGFFFYWRLFLLQSESWY